VKSIARILLLLGAGGVALSAVLPWVRVEGLPINLEWLDTRVAPLGKTVSGTDTPAWPYLLGAGALIAGLTVLNVARKLLMLFGLLVTVAGAGLTYYVMNVIDIEAEKRDIPALVAGAVADSSAKLGPFVLLASGLCILVGAVVLTRD
jgi:hypothetical protein